MIGLPWAAWTRGQWWYFALFMTLLCAWPGIVYLRAGTNSVAVVLYWLTALVVLAYTVETYGMRQEMIRQNELAVEPIVIALVETGPASRSHERVLVLKNIGKGPALFITSPECRLVDVAGDRVPFIATFTPVSFLEPGHDCIMESKGRSETQPRFACDPVKSLDPTSAHETYGLRINYQDVTGEGLMTAMQMGKGGIRLLEHRKTRQPRWAQGTS
jgi:hypothetical protein